MTTITLDGRVLAVSVVVALVCGLVFASAPAWLAAKSDLVHVMKSGSSAVTGDRRRHRSLSAFLVADIAFVCVLLVGTVFAVTSFVLVTTADLGFDRRDVMTLWYARSLADVPVAERASAEQVLRANLIGRVGAVPGVSGVAISDAQGPLAGVSSRHSIVIPGIGQTSFHDMPQRRSVTPDYFRVMGMQLLRGRLFQASDRAGAPLVMLINDVAARRFFGNRNPVGQVVTYLGPTTIVGVLKGVRFNGPEQQHAAGTLYAAGSGTLPGPRRAIARRSEHFRQSHDQDDTRSSDARRGGSRGRQAFVGCRSSESRVRR